MTGATVPAQTGCSFMWEERHLAYETYGEGDRLLVLLHGLLMDARLNRGVARALAARGHRVPSATPSASEGSWSRCPFWRGRCPPPR